jgi:hypothetical protein
MGICNECPAGDIVSQTRIEPMVQEKTSIVETQWRQVIALHAQLDKAKKKR